MSSVTRLMTNHAVASKVTTLAKKEHRRVAVFLFGLTHGREQGGAPQRAKNVPVARFLARGRVPAGSPNQKNAPMRGVLFCAGAGANGGPCRE